MYFMKQTKKGMRLLFSFLIITSVTAGLISCGSSDDDGDSTPTGEWTNPYDFKGVARSGAVQFSINDVPYIGLGLQASGTNDNFPTDIYKYQDNKWTAIAPFPGVGRTSAVAFTINGKAYVGLGSDGTNNRNDFYAYDPIADTWTAEDEIKDFEGTARVGAVAFGIDTRGYVGAGYDGNNLLDFWAYNPDTNDWEPRADILGSKRTNAFSFVIAGKAYVGGGQNNGALIQTFYSYDPTTDTWTAKNDLQDDKTDDDANDKGYTIARELAVTFVIGGKGYVVGGARASSTNTETWEYNPDADTWKKMNSFEGTPRVSAVGYSIGNVGYVATGRNSTLYLDDVWAYDPTAIDN
jgi:N-acetylneuraminic acid mutarotase